MAFLRLDVCFSISFNTIPCDLSAISVLSIFCQLPGSKKPPAHYRLPLGSFVILGQFELSCIWLSNLPIPLLSHCWLEIPKICISDWQIVMVFQSDLWAWIQSRQGWCFDDMLVLYQSSLLSLSSLLPSGIQPIILGDLLIIKTLM